MTNPHTLPSTQRSAIESNPTVPGSTNSIPQTSSTQGGPASTLLSNEEAASTLAALAEEFEENAGFYVVSQNKQYRKRPAETLHYGSKPLGHLSTLANIHKKTPYFVKAFEDVSVEDWKSIGPLTVQTNGRQRYDIWIHPQTVEENDVKSHVTSQYSASGEVNTSLLYGAVLHLAAKHSLTPQGGNLFLVVTLLNQQRAVHLVKY
jgi:hypothetical protein